LRALEKQNLFEEGTSFFRWACKIMFNLFVTDYRRKAKFETQYDPDIMISQQTVAASQEATSDWRKVRETIAKLPRNHRDILNLVCVRGMSYEETAKELSIEMGTVRSRLSRAKENLCGQL